MADFGKSLGNLALAATVSLAPMQSNAADVSKLPEAVIAKCKADTILALADFKAKIDAAAPTSAPELTASRVRRYQNQFENTLDWCLRIAMLDERASKADERIAEAQARWKELDARLNELDISGKAIAEMDTAVTNQLAFFDDFQNWKKTREEYIAQIASLPSFVETTRLRIAVARKAYLNDPSMIASFNKTEEGLKKIIAFVLSFQASTLSKN